MQRKAQNRLVRKYLDCSASWLIFGTKPRTAKPYSCNYNVIYAPFGF